MTEPHGRDGKQPLRVIHRACAVLELLADTGHPLGHTEIAARCGLAPATTHRLLTTLTSRGYLHQTSSRQFELGAVTLRLGAAASRGVAGWVNPTLTTVAEHSGESAYLSYLHGDLVSYLAQAQSAHSMRSCTEVGSRVLPHCTAAGKALLAQLSPQERMSTLARTGLPSYTPNTIADPDTLMTELDSVRTAGYAVDNEEHELSENCVAVTVPGLPFAAALSISGPNTRLRLPAARSIVELLRKAADELAAIHG